MFVWIERGCLSLAILGLLFTGAAQAQNGQGRGNGAGASGDVVQLRPAGPVPGQYIVVFEDDVSDPRGLANALARAHGFAPRHVYESALKGFAARMPAPIAEMLALDPDVAYVEQDLYAQTQLHGNTFQTIPWGVMRIEDVVNYNGNQVDVDIAIIDTGIDLDHPDLYVVFDRNFNNSSKSGDDDNGHGTHVAGSAAALDNGLGVVGVAPGARLWALKVLNRRGSGSFADVIAGIDFVTENSNQIEVVNMSLGGTGTLNALRTAIQNSVAAGVVYVVAAGNSSRDVYGNDGTFNTSDDFIPAAYPEVAAISAMGDTDGQAGGDGPDTSYGTGDDTFASFTNFSGSVVGGNPVTSSGAAIDLAGPGVDILSTYKDGMYATISGTSMASPHVAGAVAFYIAENGRDVDGDLDYDADDVAAIRQALIDSAELQEDWGPTDTDDPDGNAERLVYVGGAAIGNSPEVSWQNPNGTNSSFAKNPIDIEIDASDVDGDLATVEWRVAGQSWSSADDADNDGVFTASWSPSDGVYTLDAKGTDLIGNVTTVSVQVTVDAVDGAPDVSWVNPTESDTVNGMVAIQIDAVDDRDSGAGVTAKWRVLNVTGSMVIQDWRLASHSSGTIYTDSWDTESGLFPDADYILETRAKDDGGLGLMSTTESITVTVSNTVPEFEVLSVGYAGTGGKNADKHLLITVAVAPPTLDASVSIKLTRTEGGEWNGTGPTDEFGDVTFSLKNAQSGCYTTDVTDVDGTQPATPANEYCK